MAELWIAPYDKGNIKRNDIISAEAGNRTCYHITIDDEVYHATKGDHHGEDDRTAETEDPESPCR